VAHVRVFDSEGHTATASKQFAVGVPSSTPPPSGGRPTAAVIDRPAPDEAAPPVVSKGASAASATITLDASGTAPAEGARIKSYAWGVVSLPDRVPVASAQGPVAEVQLLPGRYQVR
jgi:hypothetical protein